MSGVSGKKVAPGGSNPPSKQENAGLVDASSLAAQSTRAGGGFASNPGQKRQQAQSGSTPSPEEYESSTTGASSTDKSTSAGLESAQMSSHGGTPAKSTQTQEKISQKKQEKQTPEGQGAPAPSYVENVLYSSRLTSGPHGKNLKEGGFEGSGTAEGPLPEPGSEQDPSRAALGGLLSSGTGNPGSKGGERGKRYSELGVDESA
ncbi:hypothetical protein QBC35DRAFT_448761 [Podospora australis]|uniref:Uncharacterized protein n=1 Tax=Podospora australis TaxID=1536484 RepID=A0AAN6WZL9_9PEZI|nr:hypothetical protein QBC35DRAFT_448761 [Podospora australis]